jgi:hypothetical protein
VKLPEKTHFRVLTALCLLFILAGGSQNALARNMNGKLGFGYQRTMLGVQGFSVGYWMTQKLALQMTAGLGFERFDINDDGTASEVWTTALLGAAGLKYVMYGTKFANLSVGALFDFGWTNKLLYSKQSSSTANDGTVTTDTSQGVENNRMQWGVEIPLEIEFFFSDAFSINLATGMFFTISPKASSEDASSVAFRNVILEQTGLGAATEPDQIGIAIGAGGLFGHAGFKFYF